MPKTPRSLPAWDERPALWVHTPRLLQNCWRLTDKPKRSSEHRIGGPSAHKGSKCKVCKRQLTLLWNLWLGDDIFSDELRAKFEPSTHLPLYICWTCSAAAYQVRGTSKLKTFTPMEEWTDIEQEPPFVNAPDELPERRISFRKSSTIVDALLSSDIPPEDFDRDARSAVMDELRPDGFNYSDLAHISQLGGQLLHLQGAYRTSCPNPKCPARSKKYPYDPPAASFYLKHLAMLCIDADPVLAPHYFQFAYQVCTCCFSINAHYSCT